MRVLTVCSMLLVGALFLACNDSPAPTEAIVVFSGKKADAPGQQEKGSAALQFDGATQSTITPDADDLDLTTTFTIEMWIKPADAAGSLQHLLSKWGWMKAAEMWLLTSQTTAMTCSSAMLLELMLVILCGCRQESFKPRTFV